MAVEVQTGRRELRRCREVYGEYVSGSVNGEQMKNVVRNSCPGAGACGRMYMANTMASAIEAMGMSLPYR
ncbi:hypothetical protein LOK49_LG06G00958 [Camellia lanceoleosa]|uniref:Uncharacterized protein n=1 Tax=Camellia lanceoleosa TaxID=1840588 RepID=A0ACC0HC15_9ERIC|nr:hypothetical protein LOK49_LG06G00958 [Camellia lanceoleosa]